jgi:hypothetical protein
MILGVNKLTELSGPKINQTEWFSEFIRSFQSENLKKKMIRIWFQILESKKMTGIKLNQTKKTPL